MHALQLLGKVSVATLFLVLCLRLGASTAWKHGDIISVSITVLELEVLNEFWIKVSVINNVKQCMVVEIRTEDSPNIEYPNACVCDTNSYYWEASVSGTKIHALGGHIQSFIQMALSLCQIFYPVYY